MSKLSIVIVSLDNPAYFNLLMYGLVKNTRTPFEVLLHINSPSQEFYDVAMRWILRGDIVKYSESVRNVGVATPANELFANATGDYFVFLDDDVYPAPGWDEALLKKVNPKIKCQYLSPILFQPIDAQTPDAEKAYNLKSFGTTFDTFDDTSFNATWKESRNIMRDTQGVCGNFFMSASLWQELGGYDATLYRGYDIDLKANVWNHGLLQYGKFEFRAVADSCLYHFAHIGHNKTGFDDQIQFTNTFQEKWKMTPGEFWNKATTK